MDNPMLKFEAGEAVAEASPRRLVALHTGAALALSLILTALSYYFGTLSGEGGIGGLGAQAALSTAQTVLQLIGVAVAPFWSAGLVFCALGCARRKDPEPQSLLEGFRRWKVILTSSALMGLRYLVTGFVAGYLSMGLLMMSPAVLSDSMNIVQSWFLGIFLIVFVILALPLYYRWRLVHYILMDEPKTGGLQAMLMSQAMLNGRKMELFRLDLSYWWFYALEFLAVGLGTVGTLLTEGAAFWGVTLLSLLCQFGLYVWAKPKLAVTYALAYETLRQPREPKTQPIRPAKPHPWNY